MIATKCAHFLAFRHTDAIWTQSFTIPAYENDLKYEKTLKKLQTQLTSQSVLVGLVSV